MCLRFAGIPSRSTVCGGRQSRGETRPELFGGVSAMVSHEYALAVDVGTSRTAAATARTGSSGETTVTPVPLGRRGDNVASVAFVTDDGDLLFADAGERRGLSQPERLIREFKRGVGDDVPIAVGGR